MEFDVFDTLMRPGADITVHNVQLVDVQPDEEGYALLTVEHAGTTRELLGNWPWSQEYSHRDVGKFGYLLPAYPFDPESSRGA